MSKLFLFAAPSGAGKTTIVRHLLKKFDTLAFSISATTRPRRPHEEEGRDYYFITAERFRQLIDEGAFVEWEEVYEGLFYGTLRAEIQRLWDAGKHIIFDIDVKGALNIKAAFPKEATTVFVKPPSFEALRKRLRARDTEDDENLRKRLERAKSELSYENQFDLVLVNNKLEPALRQAEHIIESFINET